MEKETENTYNSSEDSKPPIYYKVGNTHIPLNGKGVRMMIGAKVAGFIIFIIIMVVIYLLGQ